MASTFGSMSAFGSTSPFSSKPIPSPQVSGAEAHSKLFMRSIARLFNDAKYSDATILIHNVTLPVHKSVICIQSAYFENAFQKKFVEGTSGVLSFEEGSGAAYWRVFEYLYTGNYSEDLSTTGFEDDPALLKDPRVYALADMFFLEELKALSKKKLQEKLESSWMSDSFPDCIREVYASTYDNDSNMRSVVVEVATAHARVLGEKEIFKDLLKDGGDFVVEYAGALTKKMSMI